MKSSKNKRKKKVRLSKERVGKLKKRKKVNLDFQILTKNRIWLKLSLQILC